MSNKNPMELNFRQLNLLSIALTMFYDEVCKTGTTPGMKEDIMELSKLVNDEFSKVSVKTRKVTHKQIIESVVNHETSKHFFE
jgi:hypothetical protein